LADQPETSKIDWHSGVLDAQEYRNDTEAFTSMIGRNIAVLNTVSTHSAHYHALGYDDGYICETLSKVPFSQRGIQSGFFVPKGSPYKELFNAK